jgi:hypothetical protein
LIGERAVKFSYGLITPPLLFGDMVANENFTDFLEQVFPPARLDQSWICSTNCLAILTSISCLVLGLIRLGLLQANFSNSK